MLGEHRQNEQNDCWHICIMARSCLDIVSVKSVQREIDTMHIKSDDYVTQCNGEVI